MRGDHRSLGSSQGVEKSLVRNVRDVHHHAQPVHAPNHLAPEVRQAIVLRRIGGRIRPLGVFRVCQGHVADTQPVKDVERPQVVFNDVASLQAHEDGDLLLTVNAFNLSRVASRFQAAGMQRHLAIHCIDEVERAMNQVLWRPFHVHPDGEELSAQAALPHLGNADHVGACRIGKVVALIQHHLRRVGVSIDDNGASESAVRHLLCFGGRTLLPRHHVRGEKNDDQQAG